MSQIVLIFFSRLKDYTLQAVDTLPQQFPHFSTSEKSPTTQFQQPDVTLFFLGGFKLVFSLLIKLM